MAQQTLNAGSPPIVWSTVEDAFTKINANFDELYGSIGGPGGVLDFTSLSTDIKPSASEVYDLGSPTARWRDLYLAGSSLYLGSAQITADGAGVVNLPAGTTVAGELIRNPAETNFKTITVSGQSNIVADSFEDTLTVAAGNAGITLTTNAGTDTLTIANSGVTDLTGTAGQIAVSAATGSITLTNLGVTSLTGTAGGIGVSASTGGVTLTNLGVKQIVGTASQIGVTGDGTGIVTITNLAPASPTFRFIVIDGATLQPVAADNISDTLNLISGPGLTITKDTATDTLTFSVNSNLDIRGSVFADDSTMLVDATNGVLRGNFIGSVFADDSTQIIDGNTATVYGNIQATTLRTAETKIALGSNAGVTSQGSQSVAVGTDAGNTSQGTYSVAVGPFAGRTSQGQYSVAVGPLAGFTGQGLEAVAIGATAGSNDQGANAVAIGTYAGVTDQPANTIILNASGVVVNGIALQTNSFYVAPIRNATGTSGIVQYDASTKEVSYSSALGTVSGTLSGTFTGNIFTNLIDSADSSAITVTPKTIFSSDVNVENELTVSNGITFSDGSVLKSYSPVTVIAATTTAQTVNDAASASYIQFIETVDTAGAYSPGVFTAPYTGYYQINLSVYFSTTVTLNPGSFFLIDSNPDVVIFSGAWTGSYLHYSTVIPASAGDTIGFVFRQVSGGPIDISSSSRLAIHRVSIGA
jgi:hypothetical protein